MKQRRLSPVSTVYALAASAALAVFAVLCACFVLALAAAFSPLFAGTLTVQDAAALLLSDKVRTAALYTVRQAAASALAALAVGLPAAFFVSRRDFPLRRFLSALAPIPICLPPLLMALGFVMFFGMQGTANRLLMQLFGLTEPPLTFLYSFTGLVLVQGFYNFPLIMHTVADVWERLPRAEAEAAALLGAGRVRIFCTITLAQLLPAILSASLLVFLYCFFSFIIVLLFGAAGGSTLEVQIYQAARTAIDFESAAAFAAAETLLALCFAAAYAALSSRTERSAGFLFDAAAHMRRRLSGTGERAGAFILFACVCFFFIAPLASVALNAFAAQEGYRQLHDGFLPQFSLDAFVRVFARGGFYTAVRNTLITAFCSALLATAAGAVYAFAVQRRCAGVLARTLPILPLAVSSVIIGFGFTILIRRGTPATLVLAQAALYWPLALRQIAPAAARIPRDTEDAARLLASSRFDTVFRVFVPAAARSCISAFCFCFALSCGDASLPLILAIPRFDTLALYTYRLAGSYRLPQACVCGVLLGVFAAAVFAAGDRIGSPRRLKQKEQHDGR